MADPGAVQDRQRYEEIEIMRRILDDGLRRVARASTHDGLRSLNESTVAGPWGLVFADFDNDGQLDIVLADPVEAPADYHSWLGQPLLRATRSNDPHRGMPPIETVEGLYLKRHGVVYTAGLLVHYLETIKPSSRPVPKPLTEWERVRQQVRGDKAETPAQPLAHARESLADQVLRMLAENGHNFSSLAPDETVTVAVTLRQGMDCALCHKMDLSHTIGLSYKRLTDVTGQMPLASAVAAQGSQREHPSYSNTTGKVLVGEAAAPLNRGWTNTESENQALLGDLQMKQGRYKEAVEAYRKALEDLGKAADNDARLAEKLLQAGQADKGALQQQVLTRNLLPS
ncbi:MAG: hypothetical protein E6K70_19285 [Planctomycetota bacterium]|nr:MAG: hypothetical protein E6K70_19285 [Planctomycetota bacterium]